ncbi:hypothetical protein SAMN02745172_00030 [Pseudoxanthobacter soli DSM 19599]|uniref:Tat pathway signal protein n=1 Tax=Pseudoxanthobacter soli DSM 19599 TaxID=1123029 RepID=A0A1M7Z4D3_9HYPH|nr:Tat pathway signal protein [Pseudoxanthobacter soli]SHO59694.1 hypothetical protein SAMN02745172_00030 [Pseudoxanthobacter soli DSM 19599]
MARASTEISSSKCDGSVRQAGGLCPVDRGAATIRRLRTVLAGFAFAAAAAMTGPAAAQDTVTQEAAKQEAATDAPAATPAPIRLELNKLEPTSGGACRVYFLIENGKGPSLRSLKLDLFVLDDKGVVGKRMAVEAAPIASGKTMVKLFDVAGVECGSFGRVLLNDVISCTAADGAALSCLDRIDVSSKADVPFGK